MSVTQPQHQLSADDHSQQNLARKASAKLRVGIANPFCWPYVRRGSERILHDLSHYLAEMGHEVTVIAGAPTAGDTERLDENIRQILFRERLRSTPFGRQLNSAHIFSLQCRRGLRNHSFDMLHCLSYYDGFAAARHKRSVGQPFVYQMVGIPTRKYFRTVPLDRHMFNKTLKCADRILVCSHHARDSLKREFDRTAEVLPPPIDTDHFRPYSCEDGPPTILMVGCVDEVRKGGSVLLQAFVQLKREVPDAILQISGQASEEMIARLLKPVPPQLRDNVQFLGVGEVNDLPQLYSRATVTVLPSVWEAFGMVLVESLACGTPVVGCNHAGILDIITDPAVGALFEPGNADTQADNVDGLTRALLDVLTLSRDPDIADRCKQHAQQFSWNRLGPRYEQLYLDVING